MTKSTEINIINSTLGVFFFQIYVFCIPTYMEIVLTFTNYFACYGTFLIPKFP